ncbi:MAG: ABC transporter permease [Bacteroidia bacterium]
MKHFTGTLALMRFIFKRDKIALLCWVLILPLLPLATASAFAKLYPDAAAIQAFAASVNINPAEIALLGHVLSPTLGALVVWRWTAQSVIFLGIFNLFFVTKHSRSEEETGRYELLSSTAIGRYAMLSATLGVAFIANLLIGISISFYLIQYGLPTEGSLALGISAFLTGILMATCTAFVAQLSRQASKTRGIMGVILTVIYLFKAVGEGGDNALVWLSPMCWLHKIRPYADENWAITLLFVAFSVILTTFSYYFLSKRDIGTGFLKEMESKGVTSPLLNNSLALAWRLHRSSIFGWTVSFAGIGMMIGFMMDAISAQIGTNPEIKAFLLKMGNTNMGDLMFTLVMAMLSQVLAAYAIMSSGKMQVEEIENRSDIVLSLAVSRTRWAMNHLLVILAGIFIVLFTMGTITGFCYGLTIDAVGEQTFRILGATLAFLPALCVIAAFAFLIFAISPQRFYISWIFLVFLVLLGFLQELVPDAKELGKLSPFTHVPQVLVGGKEWINLLWLSLTALILAIAGIFYYRKRDIY